jgi:hypothetical protein
MPRCVVCTWELCKSSETWSSARLRQVQARLLLLASLFLLLCHQAVSEDRFIVSYAPGSKHQVRDACSMQSTLSMYRLGRVQRQHRRSQRPRVSLHSC